MTEKQKIFADEYLIDLNATRAYRVAYPSVKKEESAAVNGSKLLRNAKVAEYITERMEERQKRTEITQDRVLNELAAIAFSKASETGYSRSRWKYYSARRRRRRTDSVSDRRIGAYR